MKVLIDDVFWNDWIEVVQDQMLPFQWRVLNDLEANAPKSGAIMNFKLAAKEAEGEFHGMVFQDTDLYKWLEAVAYSLQIKENKDLQKLAEEAIDLIGRAQMPDGYVNTYFQAYRPDLRWTNLTDNHELYTFGHLIEAGVAFYQATHNQKIYDIIVKVADLLVDQFGYGKKEGLPGHPEIELALFRLYELTNEEKYLNLVRYFVLERGSQPNYFIEEPRERIAKGIPSWLDIIWNNGFVKPQHENDEDMTYYVASKKLVDQVVVEGHAVRACYLYSALADLAKLDQDSALKDAAERLYDNVVTKQMYITGGLGQTNRNEGFTHDYDLPNESNYCETCAGISLIYWSHRMLKLSTNSQYADVIERTLYNNTLGSMALDGKSFYYRNELERWGPNIHRAGRPKWHACACCPPNLARLLLSLGQYAYHEDRDILFVDQFIAGDVKGNQNGETYHLKQTAHMPWENTISLTVVEAKKGIQLGVRVPDWSPNYQLKQNKKMLYEGIDYTVNRGYLILHQPLNEDDELTLELDMAAKYVYANTRVKQDAGKVALTRGPLVYCVEEEDNGGLLWQLQLNPEEPITEKNESELNGIISLDLHAQRDHNHAPALYSYAPAKKINWPIKAIPYYARYNRSVGEIQVWLRSN